MLTNNRGRFYAKILNKIDNMENDIKFQLEEIKKLYDSKSITESEYKLLKDEILFGNKEDSLLSKYKSQSKSYDVKSERNVFNEVKNGNDNVFESNKGFKKIGIFCISLCFLH
jgi:hypothetical protein